MTPKLLEVRHSGEYRLWLRFSDGAQGELDLAKELWGEIFEPLKDVSYFATVRLAVELNTVTLDNGADFAPEYLYEGLSSSAAA